MSNITGENIAWCPQIATNVFKEFYKFECSYLIDRTSFFSKSSQECVIWRTLFLNKLH